MYAIVRIGGKQYHAEVGQTIVTERLASQVGDKLEFSDVLLVADGPATVIGRPVVEGSVVRAEVVEQFRGKKIIVYKFKPKQRYRRKQGHRQYYTRLMITGIGAPGKKPGRSRKAQASGSEEAGQASAE